MKQNDIEHHERQHMPLEKLLDRLLRPLEMLLHSRSITGITLLFAALLALFMANSGFADFYHHIRELDVGFFIGGSAVSFSLHHWVNDGLMALFFYLLGAEIKRELLVGELRDIRQSQLLIIMALGGMVMPALWYTLFNYGASSMGGWGIPMATDTAFALGVLSLLGSRVPRSVGVLLSALAIVDDIGAVLVIAVFYTENLAYIPLMWAGLAFAALFLLNSFGVRRPLFYIAIGIVLWWFVLLSGVHSTVAGILVALTVPTKPYAQTGWFIRRIRRLLAHFEQLDSHKKSIFEHGRQHQIVEQVRDVARKTITPLQHWTGVLDKPVSLAILPLFAFLNAGVELPSSIYTVLESPVALGIVVGLILGKPLGICLFTWLSLRFNFGRLPNKVAFSHVVGLSFLAGMGFTMSMFIAVLAFGGGAPELNQAKIGILLASLIAAIVGVAVLYGQSKLGSRERK